jgi:hypothetical protein
MATTAAACTCMATTAAACSVLIAVGFKPVPVQLSAARQIPLYTRSYDAPRCLSRAGARARQQHFFHVMLHHFRLPLPPPRFCCGYAKLCLCRRVLICTAQCTSTPRRSPPSLPKHAQTVIALLPHLQTKAVIAGIRRLRGGGRGGHTRAACACCPCPCPCPRSHRSSRWRRFWWVNLRVCQLCSARWQQVSRTTSARLLLVLAVENFSAADSCIHKRVAKCSDISTAPSAQLMCDELQRAGSAYF